MSIKYMVIDMVNPTMQDGQVCSLYSSPSMFCSAGGCPMSTKPMSDRSCDPPCTKARSLCTEVSQEQRSAQSAQFHSHSTSTKHGWCFHCCSSWTRASDVHTDIVIDISISMLIRINYCIDIDVAATQFI